MTTGAETAEVAGDGELPEGWAWATVGELCDVNPRGFDEPLSDDDLLSRVPMAAVEAETGCLDPSLHVRFGDVKKKSLTSFQEEDVLFAKITPCMENGKIALASGLLGKRAVGSTEFMVLRSVGAVAPRYLMHYLLQTHVRRQAQQNMVGAVGQRRVPRPYLEALRIPVPPLPEQHRIVAKLEEHLVRIQVGEAAAKAALSSSQHLAEQVSGQGALGGLGSHGPLVDHALEDAGVSDGELPKLPVGWGWTRLGDVADVVGGVTKDSKKQADATYVEVPYLRVANVQRGALDLKNVATIRVPASKAQALRLESGDVLLNEGGDRDKLGRGWIWEGQIENCIHQNHVFRARIRGAKIHPRILAWHANSFGKNWCDRNGSQVVNLASISLRKIKLLPVPVPPADIQEDLVKEVEKSLAAVQIGGQLARDALSGAVELRSSLLATAFEGRLVSQDPADEPAPVLLARIRAEQAAHIRKRAPRRKSI